jgi:hypothetical protein
LRSIYTKCLIKLFKIMKIKLYQEGGPVAPQEAAPAGPEGGAPGAAPGGAPAEGGQDPLMQIAQMFAQGLQAQDCQALAQGAQMFLELISQQQGGQGGPAPAEPTVMRKGGKFVLKTKGDGKEAPVKGNKNDKVDMSKCGGKAKK